MSVILFHGATERVEQPIVNAGRPNLDFGPAFYLTRLRAQAETWAYRTMVRRNAPKQWINLYELDLERALAEGARYHHFAAYDDQWLDFMVGNRRGFNLWQQYDIVEGGIANDRVVNAVELYAGGLINREEALGRLIHEDPNNQFALLTQSIVDGCLKYISSELLGKPVGENGAQEGGTPC